MIIIIINTLSNRFNLIKGQPFAHLVFKEESS